MFPGRRDQHDGRGHAAGSAARCGSDQGPAPTGHVLIDGGVPANAALIEANIRGLGIDLRDIRWILGSHAQCDHAGGIARLARDTGAKVIASVAGAEALARGGRDDPQCGDALPLPPVHVARTVADGESLRLGGLVLTAPLG